MTTAVVVARAPGDPAVLPGLAPVLGAERAATLQAALIRRAAAWAADVAPGAAYVAVAPGARAAAGSAAPVDADGAPVDADGAPVDADGAPVDADGAPVDADGAPVDADGAPVDADGAPVDADGAPVDADGAPVDADAGPLARVAALLPRGVEAFVAGGGSDADLLAAAVARAGRGPLLIARPGCARLARAHADAALDDLRAGCGVVLGATLDGGWYLIGLHEPRPELLAVAGAGRGIGAVLEQVRRHGAEVGLLRHERLLATPDDAAALLADPLTPADLRAALGG